MTEEHINIETLKETNQPLCVKHLMSTQLFTVYEDDNIQLVDDLMKWRRIRHIPVINQVNKLMGLITHRDLLKASISSLTEVKDSEKRKLNTTIPAYAIMRADVFSIRSDATLKEAASTMIENKYGCLPVVDNNELVGIITEADFVKLVNAFLPND